MTMNILALIAALVAGYVFGRAVGIRLATRVLRAEGPDVLVTAWQDGQTPHVQRVRRGEVYRLRCPNGEFIVGFAKTRPLPAGVAQMLEEVTQ